MVPQTETCTPGADTTELRSDWVAFMTGSLWDACEWTGAEDGGNLQDSAEVVLDLSVRCCGPGVVFDRCAGKYGGWVADACAKM